MGAPYKDCSAGMDCGAAYVYRFNGSTWVEEQKLTAPKAAAEDQFGQSVSVSENTAVIGAPFDVDCASELGCSSAYVYRFNGSTWVEEQRLTASDAAPNDQFGVSVSVSGDVVIVGARSDDCAVGIGCGSAYVHRFDGIAWVEQAKLTASDAAPGDYLGSSVGVSEDRAIAGTLVAADACEPGSNCGLAYVFAPVPPQCDCNNNGVDDTIDIATCVGDPACDDCNGDLVPDACDITDCVDDPACKSMSRS